MNFNNESPKTSQEIIKILNQGKIINKHDYNNISVIENVLFTFISKHKKEIETFYYLLNKRLINTDNISFHIEDKEDINKEITELTEKTKVFKAEVFICFLSFSFFMAKTEHSSTMLGVEGSGLNKEELINFIEKDIVLSKAILKTGKNQDFNKLLTKLIKKGVLFEKGNNITYSDFGYSFFLKFKDKYNKQKETNSYIDID
jgi:hypothetical protein